MTNNPQIHAEPISGAADEREIHALERRQLDVQARLGERVAALEATVKTFATKEDLANTKLWAVTSILGTAFTLLVAVSVMVSRFWPR